MKITARVLYFLLPALFGNAFLAAQTEYKVYPGDTNNDAVVNVRDLLPIGIAFGREVNAREDMAIDWNAKLAVDSLGFFLPNTFVNFVHLNSNGDQLINEQDMDAIRLNYDSIVTEVLPPAWAPEVFAPVSFCPELKVYFDRDTAFLQDTFFAEIWLELPTAQPLPPPDGILGISFSFTYPLDYINDKFTRIIPNPEAEDLLYVTANAQAVNTVKSFPPGQGDVAAAGKGANMFLLRQLIVRVGIVVEDMIFRSPVDRPFWIDILPESVLMVNNREERFKYCLSPSDTIILSDRISTVKEIDREMPLRLWPNPNDGNFQLALPVNAQRIQLFNSNGTLLWSQRFSPLSEIAVQLPELPNGAYFILLETPELILRKRFVLMH